MQKYIECSDAYEIDRNFMEFSLGSKHPLQTSRQNLRALRYQKTSGQRPNQKQRQPPSLE